MSGSTTKPTVLISGSSTGIGEATAVLLAQKDWIVYAGVRKDQDAEKLKAAHQNIRPVMLDVTKPEDIAKCIEQVKSETGDRGLDVLVNNAGLGYSGSLELIFMDQFEKQYDVNVFGVMRLTQAALPLLKTGKPGRIINVASVGSDLRLPWLGPYLSTKAALQSLSETMRIELEGAEVKVSLIKPGPVKTNIVDTGKRIIQDTINERCGEGTEAHKLYGKDLAAISNFETADKIAISPEVVAKRIYQAITARSPKNKYYDTWLTYFVSVFFRYGPTWLVDYYVKKIFFSGQ